MAAWAAGALYWWQGVLVGLRKVHVVLPVCNRDCVSFAECFPDLPDDNFIILKCKCPGFKRFWYVGCLVGEWIKALR